MAGEAGILALGAAYVAYEGTVPVQQQLKDTKPRRKANHLHRKKNFCDNRGGVDFQAGDFTLNVD